MTCVVSQLTRAVCVWVGVLRGVPLTHKHTHTHTNTHTHTHTHLCGRIQHVWSVVVCVWRPCDEWHTWQNLLAFHRYGGVDTDGVTPIVLRGPWPATPNGTEATIVCDLNAGVDDEVRAVSYTHLTLPTIYSV